MTITRDRKVAQIYFWSQCQENLSNFRGTQENDEEKSTKCTSKARIQAMKIELLVEMRSRCVSLRRCTASCSSMEPY